MSAGDCTVVALVPHPDRPAVLTAASAADGPRLPTATIDGAPTLETSLDAVEAMLGVVPIALRADSLGWTADDEPTLMLLDIDPIGPRAPSSFRWTPWAELRLDGLAPDVLRDGVARWIARRERGPQPVDPPWTMPGWFDRAASWMRERMSALGTPPDGPTRIVHLWGISIVLRTPSPGGAMYLKCAAPIFRHEAAVTGRIAEVTPGQVVRVAAVEPAEGWLLMHDLGGRTLGRGAPTTWASGLVAHARIQQAWSGRTAELVAAGAPVRSLTDLAGALPTLADGGPIAAELSGDDLAEWRGAMPGFIEACRRLDDLGPAPTLVHGDLHPWNVADTPDGPRLFDWTDAAVSHPFTDLAVYATRPDDPAIRRAIRDAYLACWADRLPAADLAEAGDLAIVVGTLYQVETYGRLLSSLASDDRIGLEGAAGSWARAAVGALREGIDLRRPGHADG
jgi:hypothetical protein